MSGVVLTVVGSLSEDLTVVGERLPAPGETVLTADLQRSPGGKGANQAAAAGRLAGRARFVGARGDDEAGRRSAAALEAVGVDCSELRIVERPTGTALIVVDAAGENLIAVAPGANAEVVVPGSLASADAILLQLEIPMDTVLAAARSCPGFVALNAAPARELPAELIERCDLIIVNETEYAAIPALAGARRVAVTYGAAGAAILERGVEVARSASRRARVVSSVGAGDAFCAALVLALVAGHSDEVALATACAVGAAAVESEGAQPPLGRLEDYLPS